MSTKFRPNGLGLATKLVPHPSIRKDDLGEEIFEQLVYRTACLTFIIESSDLYEYEFLHVHISQYLATIELDLLEKAKGYDELWAAAEPLIEAARARKSYGLMCSQGLGEQILSDTVNWTAALWLGQEVTYLGADSSSGRGLPLPCLKTQLEAHYQWVIDATNPRANLLMTNIVERKKEIREWVAQHKSDYPDGPTSDSGVMQDFVRQTEKKYGIAIKHCFPKSEPVENQLRARYLRACNGQYLIGRVNPQVKRDQEAVYFRIGMIHSQGNRYVSALNLNVRRKMLLSAQQWAEDTYVVPSGEQLETCANLIRLADIMKTPVERFAKVYAMVCGLDRIAEEHKLGVAMITLTLPPAYHPNPEYGQAGNWSGYLPREASDELTRRLKNVFIGMANRKMYFTGLKVIEPHKDGCPHAHLWVLYDPKREGDLLDVLQTYYKGPIRYRGKFGDSLYSYREGQTKLSDRVPMPEGITSTLIDFSVIDRTKSKGSTYLLKYLLKSFPIGKDDENYLTADELAAVNNARDQLAKELKAQSREFGICHPDLQANHDELDVISKREQTRLQIERTDAWRSTHGIRAFDFFGMNRCLTLWDEFRRLTKRPSHPFLIRLWVAARGINKEGRIAKGAGIRGDAYTFLITVGGVRAISHLQENAEHHKYKLSLCHQEGFTRYGEPSKKIKGILLQEREEVPLTGRQTKKRYTWQHVAIAVTRQNEWELKHTPTFKVKQITKSLAAQVNESKTEAVTISLDSSGQGHQTQFQPLRYQAALEFEDSVTAQRPHIPSKTQTLSGPTLNGR